MTDDAKAALEEIACGLDALEAGANRLKGTGGRAVVLVTTSQSIAANWLMYRLADFLDRYPDIDVRLNVCDRLVDVAHGEADLAIRCGPGDWKGVHASKLMNEEVVAVAAKSLLGDGVVPLQAWFARQIVLHDATQYAGAGLPTWDQWFERAAIDLASDTRLLTINSTPAVVQAAAAGQGVALVRKLLVANDVATGRLVELQPGFRWPIRWGYYAVVRTEALRRREVSAFHGWLLDAAQHSLSQTQI